MSRPRVVCLVGPTASGKTALALALAPTLGAEVVSVDSRQVYRDMDIGTAKPTRAERAAVPHHCLDLVEPEDGFDAARFRVAASAAIADVRGRGRVPLIAGGTGLWLRVLLRGLCPAPASAPALRAELEQLAAVQGVAALHARLGGVDPIAAARLHPNDRVRVVRALEVALGTGKPLSAWQAAHRFGETPYDALVIGLAVEPDALGEWVATRARAMIAGGWLDEVRALVARGVPDDAPAWRSVGYRELRAHVRGAVDLETALAATVRATRRFAGRQRRWFRSEPDVVWRDPRRDAVRIADEVTGFLRLGRRPLPAPPPAR
ncbi:MAG: tRNA (adenosine(37)-N6)-dimethylallyltransferase MiaA [Candidatus Binatia bacterium]